MSDAFGFSALASAFADDRKCAAIYVDAVGTVRSWNRAAETLFGYSAAEAIGRRADIIVPESLREAHWAGFNRAMLSSWRGSKTWDRSNRSTRTGICWRSRYSCFRSRCRRRNLSGAYWRYFVRGSPMVRNPDPSSPDYDLQLSVRGRYAMLL
jgi:PAS domain-containing protein